MDAKQSTEERRAGEHNAAILDQFTRQAVPFATTAAIRSMDLLGRIVQMAGPTADDTVLDVACGPGLLTCAFAHVVRQATGIDLTPAMLEQARVEQREQDVANVTWEIGDATQLPYKDGEFSLVVTRFTFHHFLDPLSVLREMRRVCRPGGRVVVADSAPAPSKAEAFDTVETLRDPSHVHALPIDGLRALFAESGLDQPRIGTFRLEGELDDLLERSFPNEGDEAHIRKMYEDSLRDDALDLATRQIHGKIFYGFPVAVLAATNPGK